MRIASGYSTTIQDSKKIFEVCVHIGIGSALVGVIAKYVLPRLGFDSIAGSAVTSVSRFAFKTASYSFIAAGFIVLATFVRELMIKSS